MLTLKFIQDNKDEVIHRLKTKNFDATAIVEQIITLDINRRQTQIGLESLQSEMNNLSKEIGQLFKSGKAEEANQAKARTGEMKEQIKDLTVKMEDITSELQQQLVQLPNLPHTSVPAGKGEDDNVVVSEGGQMPQLHDAVPHWDLIKKYDLIDFELGTKITGAGFPVYKGK